MGELGKDMNIAFLPPGESYFANRIFSYDSKMNRDNCCDPYIKLHDCLMSRGHTINTIDISKLQLADLLIVYSLNINLKHILKEIKKNKNVFICYVQTEPELICRLHRPIILADFPFDIVFTWNELPLKRYSHYKKMNIMNPIIDIQSVPHIPFKDRKLCCMIIGNKMVYYFNELYSERLAAVSFFARKNANFDLFGMGWESSNDPLVKKVYKGTVVSKKEMMQHYKFAICYENNKGEMGYITEKIFDCFAAGCVPVYYGAHNVTDYIPKECFIDFLDFADYEELYSFMMNMEEKEYNEYLKAVKKFLQTDAYKEFTSEAYVRNIMHAIEELKRKKVNRNFYKVKLDLMWHVIKNMGFYLKNFKRTRRFVFDIMTVW